MTMMTTRLQDVCNMLLRSMGLELHRAGSTSYWQRYVTRLNEELSIYHMQTNNRDLWVKQLALKTVIDVGANLGQFSTKMRKLLPNVVIYAFEPLPDCFKELQVAFAGDSCFHAFNVGLGDAAGQSNFMRNQSCASSSFLKITPAHTDAFPFTANTSSVIVKMERLDDMAKGMDLMAPFMLKIDVQGFEDRVLRGGGVTARKAKVVLLETSFLRLYEQQPLFDDIYMLLKGWGFAYQGSFEQLRDPGTGWTVQEDSVFVRQ